MPHFAPEAFVHTYFCLQKLGGDMPKSPFSHWFWLIPACIADAMCTRKPVAQANECKMSFDIFPKPME